MSVSTHKPLILIALFLIIIFGSGLRLFYLGSFPPKGESYDEYAWTFLGTNLLTSLTPKSWSYFPYPIKEHKTIQGNYYPIVKPFLDNPPLFSLFPGSIQALSGRPYDNPLPLSILRLSMLPIAVLNMLLIYLICSRLFGEKAGLFGTLLFATIPTIVFANRLILSENFLTALLFLHIWIVTSEKIQRRSQLLLFLTSGLAILTKVSGLCIVGGSIVFLLSKKDRNVIFPVLGSLFGGILLLLYANAYDLSWFIQLQMFQSHLRFSSLINFVEGFYFQSKLGVKQFFDSSALVAKLALTSTFLQNQHLQWFQPFALYSIFQILFIYLAVGEFTSAVPGLAPGPSLYGWYFYPLIYLCIIPLTWIVKHIITSENKLSFIFLNVLWLPQLRTFFSALQSRKSIYREEFYYFCDRTPSWNVFCYRETVEKSCVYNSRDTYLREYRCCSEHDRLA